MACCLIIFWNGWMPIVSHKVSNLIQRMDNSFCNRFCSFMVMQLISLSSRSVIYPISVKLQVVASVPALERQMRNCGRLSGFMLAVLYSSSLAVIFIRPRSLVNMLLGLGALVQTFGNRCCSWCSNHWLKNLCLSGVIDGFRAPIALLPSDNQQLTKWLPLVGLNSGTPEIALVLLYNSFQPHTQELPL